MTRLLFGLFLIAHGFIHVAVWLAPAPPNAPFDSKHSWLLNGIGIPDNFVRIFAVMMSIVSALTLIGGGIGLLTHQPWWQTPILIGLTVSLILILVYFNPWLSLAVLLNLVVIYLVAIRHWPAG